MAKKSQVVPPGQSAPGQRFANPNTNKPATPNAPQPGKPPTHLPGSGVKKGTKMSHGHQ
jgi:hypothetical protein